MTEIKLTKNELRLQQGRLQQLQKYLPTLQLKKAMLQLEVTEASIEIVKCQQEFSGIRRAVDSYAELLTEPLPFNIQNSARITKVDRRYENIAGVEVPYFEGIHFEDFSYNLFDTPVWVDSVTAGLKKLATAKIRIEIAEQKKTALEKEWREVSIRVNLFEKVLIPRAIANIKKIKVFLGDQQLSAVSQAKVAKAKIEKRKKKLLAGASYAL